MCKSSSAGDDVVKGLHRITQDYTGLHRITQDYTGLHRIKIKLLVHYRVPP